MENNKFTILITTYNRPEKIKKHLITFESVCWNDLNDCKPTIMIADDLPGGGLRELCEEYQGKLKFFNLVYLERKERLGQGFNLFHAIKTNIKSDYIWPVGDDDVLLPEQAVDFINNINKNTPDVAVCEFRQGVDYRDGTFFPGKTRIVNDIGVGLELIARFGKGTSIVFKVPDYKMIQLIEDNFLGCMYEDRAFAVFSYLCSKRKKLYLKTELTAVGDSDYGLLRYSQRVFVNLTNCMNLAVKLSSNCTGVAFPKLKNNAPSEFRWWINGLYGTINPKATIKYTKKRFIKELLVSPLVIKRALFGKKVDRWIK
jgi:glycosyltransferase involved in cell wall biosynthesis